MNISHPLYRKNYKHPTAAFTYAGVRNVGYLVMHKQVTLHVRNQLEHASQLGHAEAIFHCLNIYIPKRIKEFATLSIVEPEKEFSLKPCQQTNTVNGQLYIGIGFRGRLGYSGMQKYISCPIMVLLGCHLA